MMVGMKKEKKRRDRLMKKISTKVEDEKVNAKKEDDPEKENPTDSDDD